MKKLLLLLIIYYLKRRLCAFNYNNEKGDWVGIWWIGRGCYNKTRSCNFFISLIKKYLRTGSIIWLKYFAIVSFNFSLSKSYRKIFWKIFFGPWWYLDIFSNKRRNILNSFAFSLILHLNVFGCWNDGAQLTYI